MIETTDDALEVVAEHIHGRFDEWHKFIANHRSDRRAWVLLSDMERQYFIQEAGLLLDAIDDLFAVHEEMGRGL